MLPNELLENHTALLLAMQERLAALLKTPYAVGDAAHRDDIEVYTRVYAGLLCLAVYP